MILEIPGYPIGSNITIMNAFYERPKKNEETGKYDIDYLTIVFKDNETGEKKVHLIPSPQYTYYMANPEIQIGFNMDFIEMDKVHPITCNYRDIKESIAKETGNLDLYKENLRTGNYKLNDNFFAHPRVFAADMPILNYYRMLFAASYKNPVENISVAYYDIETDIIDQLTDEIIIGESPINAISLYFDATNTIYSFVLRNPKNPQIEEFEKDITKNFKKYEKKVNDFIEQNLGSEEKAKKYRLKDAKLSVGFFDEEINLLIAFFQTMHKLSPDMAVAYNASFDLRYIAARIQKFGMDPATVMSEPDFPRKFYYYLVDEKNYNNFEERGDYVFLSSKTAYIDQMIVYASRRKGQGAIPSFKLEDIVSSECGAHKLDWSHITNRFALFPYKDFVTFWLYNINDTIVQACLEAQVEDLRYVFNNVIEMNTPYQKIFRQTNYLYSKGMEFYKTHAGVIMGCNVNRFNSKPDVKFPGAFVADPMKLSNKNKYKYKGIYIMKFANADDFDYKALYPSLLREFNMSVSTQIGMIQIENPLYKGAEYLRLGNGGHFTENLASYNFIEFCHRWLNLPNVEEMLEQITVYYNTYRTPEYEVRQGVLPNKPMDISHKKVIREVDPHRPVVFDPPIPNWLWEEINKIRSEKAYA